MAILSKIIALSIAAGSAAAAPLAAPAPVAVASNFNLVSGNSTLSRLAKRAEAVNYNQDYIAGGADVTYTPDQSAGSFSVNFDTSEDFVVGLGWKPGDSNPITYSGSFSATGVGLLSVYGWMTDPLVEYYIMEDGIGYQPEGTKMGTLTSDGSVYDIYEHQQVNQPSIEGTSTFEQYISIRQTPRSSGTVTVENHFSAWAAAGLTMGTQNFQVIAVESWSGSGKGDLTISKGTASSSGSGSGTGSGSAPSSSTTPHTTPHTTSVEPTSPAPTTGSGTVAAWGQCGGSGYKGSTTCAAGSTCKASNQWYSQCIPS